MSLSYDLFWSFRSPYSYMITPRLLKLEQEFFREILDNVRW